MSQVKGFSAGFQRSVSRSNALVLNMAIMPKPMQKLKVGNNSLNYSMHQWYAPCSW